MPVGLLGLLLGLMVLFCSASAVILWLVSLLSVRRPGSVWVQEGLCVDRGCDRNAPFAFALASHRGSG